MERNLSFPPPHTHTHSPPAEEILNSNTALWFSPDGKRLVYASLNDSLVDTVTLPQYDSSHQYPAMHTLRYPKVRHWCRKGNWEKDNMTSGSLLLDHLTQLWLYQIMFYMPALIFCFSCFSLVKTTRRSHFGWMTLQRWGHSPLNPIVTWSPRMWSKTS